MIIEQLIFTVSSIAIFVSLLFVLSLLVKRNDIADIAWGAGIFIVGVVNHLFYGTNAVLQIILLLVLIWAVRLALRIHLRNRGKGEDFRYKAWRDSWGKWFYLRSYLQVYLLQGTLMIVVGYGMIHVSAFGESATLGALGVLGIAVWTIGFFFEAVGDYQLDKFIKNPDNKGRILQTGLWRYTRHPNYFGEVTMWWGIWLLVATLPYGWVALISPLAITFLILKVSGIPMLEKKYEGNEAFQAYKRKTNAFFPGSPTKAADTN